MYPWTSDTDLLHKELERLRSTLGGLLNPSTDTRRSCDAPLWSEPRLFLPINVREEADTFVVTAEIPGVAKEDLEIKIDGDTLTIKGERRPEPITGEASCHRRERAKGLFQRTFTLPFKVDTENGGATYRNGVLTVTLPKGKPTHRRQITVRSE